MDSDDDVSMESSPSPTCEAIPLAEGELSPGVLLRIFDFLADDKPVLATYSAFPLPSTPKSLLYSTLNSPSPVVMPNQSFSVYPGDHTTTPAL